jgi:hypothetical protein
MLIAVACTLMGAPTTTAQSDVIVNAQEIKWGPAPPSIPSGAAAASSRQSGKDGLFSLRLNCRGLPSHHQSLGIVTMLPARSAWAW